MPRLARFLPPNNAFHVMCRGNNSNDVFHLPLDYLKYLELIDRYKAEHPFDLFHYCLMTNHVHLLVMIKENQDFSNFMKRLNLSYFKYYQKNYGYTGHFWQDRFKSKLITQDSYLIQCGKYTELNPVRANLVTAPSEYIWSSYGYYATGEPNGLITENLIYESLGKDSEERRRAYVKMTVEEIFSFDNQKVAEGSKESVYNANRRFRYHRDNKDATYRKSRS